MRRAALVLLVLSLTGCETTAQRSAKLERAALLSHHDSGQAGLTIGQHSRAVKVVSATVLHSSEGTAAVVTLRNVSSEAVRDSPLLISVSAADGSALYSNDASGLAHSLIAAPLIGPHSEITWVDDQVQGTGVPTHLAATVGEGTVLEGVVPQIAVDNEKLVHEGSGASAEGTAVNHSSIEQRELSVYAIAQRGGKVLAAGRAVIPTLSEHASAHFQLYFIGDPTGAKLTISAPATSG